MAAEPCKVMVVDDHPAVRRGVEAMVRRQRNIRLLASAGDGARALQQAAEDPPDVVLMDVSMPGLSGVETTRLIKQASPGVRVIGLSAWSDPDTLAAMLAAGAEQLLGKDVSEASLADAILNPPEAG
jgi:DNA-binding NarL/FixJ family response regulator